VSFVYGNHGLYQLSTTMKNVIASFACLILGLVLFTGCASSSSDSGSTNASGNVALLFSPPVKPYSDVGSVAAPKVQPSGMTWQRALQRQAATFGAEAVIVNNADLNNPNTAIVTGKAIKYQ
jgi:hypothetical protein